MLLTPCFGYHKWLCGSHKGYGSFERDYMKPNGKANEDRENPMGESRKISKKTALLAILVAILIFYFLYKKAIDNGFQGF